MLNPPSPPPETEAIKRSEAVLVLNRLEKMPGGGWLRVATFRFEGESYEYAMEALRAPTEDEARRILFAEKPTLELQAVFLRDVHLDMTRPH